MTASLTLPGVLTTPQLRYTETQTAVCEAMLCFKQNDRGEAADRQIKITAYGRLALVLKDVPGGSAVSVSGNPEMHEIQKPQYKEKRIVLSARTVHVYRDGGFVELTGGTEDDATPSPKPPQNTPPTPSVEEDDFDGEIPF